MSATEPADREGMFTRREYLVLWTMGLPAPINVFMAIEAVDTTAFAHPEWDMDETRTWAEWEVSSDARGQVHQHRT